MKQEIDLLKNYPKAKRNLMKCNICKNNTLSIFKSNVNLSISSDGCLIDKGIEIYQCPSCGYIQKDKDINCKDIYEHYKSTDIIGGLDQIKFENGVPSFRGDITLNKVLPYFKDKKSLLDIGTGAGVFLSACSKVTNLSLNAYDLNDNFKEKILHIKNVQSFYSGNIDSIDKTFDIISLIHVLGCCVPNLIDFIKNAKEKLNNNGILLVQVPYVNKNPNDVVNYDHLSHFSYDSLSRLLLKVFDNIHVIKTGIENEISIIAGDSLVENKGLIKDNIKIDFQYINRVNDYLLSQNDKIYIFGTAPISLYFAHVLLSIDKLAGFLDEYELKVGEKLLGLKIYHPKNMSDIKCFIPLSEGITKKICFKYEKICFISKENV